MIKIYKYWKKTFILTVGFTFSKDSDKVPDGVP